ncbi:protein of unknown function DUF6 transmembrane [Leptothrix cholodnii SP-6]|uniref:EamA domain-containing protein n=1 Tax=Leptothrix cholodnii (strain ATCC 51168 / LMG 8142 / SP-6) TaxID=395495 RepID=B1XY71_LEPCP|nr:DMT family transporter [Leptothrix cholodnii]ACB33972.1 protein of unknown function DUF6 transmembrane [Leptothrix cholodnii SP-6]
MKLSHSRAVLVMLLVTLLWSIAGVVSRHLEAARSFEVTFWRSAACALALLVILARQRGGLRALWRGIGEGGALMWWSGLCWSVMFTAFMMALTLTTVANVLITMALAPLFTALISRVWLGHRLAPRTWVAIVVAGAGIAWMFGSQLSGEGAPLLGTLVALTVPIGGAIMWTLAQHNVRQHPDQRADMLLAVLIGAVISSLLTLPPAWPLQGTLRDIGLLSMLGVVQLAIPCLLAVAAGKVLKAPEASLLGLLEIIFGVTWTWLGTAESPTPAVLGGGALVIGALAANEALALFGSRRLAAATGPA